MSSFRRFIDPPLPEPIALTLLLGLGVSFLFAAVLGVITGTFWVMGFFSDPPLPQWHATFGWIALLSVSWIFFFWILNLIPPKNRC